jgi:putative Mn2+ efflux pump MntP
MKTYELILLAVALAMDAFAVAVCKGLSMRKINHKYALIIGLFFGFFQAMMPTLGWFLGKKFEMYITNFDHWIAFILLAFIGGKMIYECLTEEDSECSCCESILDIKELTVLSIATSIDALAAGITFACLNVNIKTSASLIGIITFALSYIGVAVGNKFGSKYKKKAELSGGIVLILIGIKILLEHLGILA